MSNEKVKQFLKGDRKLQPNPVNLKRKIGWDSTFAPLTKNTNGEVSLPNRGTQAQACDPPPTGQDMRVDASQGRTQANACDPPPSIYTTLDRNSCTWPKGHDPAAKTVAFYECPHCSKVEPSTLGNFQLADLDVKQLCSSCRHRTALKLWKCKCNIKWHMCKTHKNALGV